MSALGQLAEWLVRLTEGDTRPAPAESGEAAGGLESLRRVISAYARLHRTATDAASREVLFRWGQLEVLERIGSGSYGEVFRAFDGVLERDVALKLRSSEQVAARAYILEARRLARVRHPHVLAIHGAAVNDGRVGIWADLIDGQTLSAWVAENGPRPRAEVLAAGRMLASALAAVHRAGLIHGDVKPGNIMRGADGGLVLMDFGAAIERAAEGTRATLGSPLTMAPEQLDGSRIGPAADLYALGVVLFHLATGRYPLESGSIDELAALHARGGAADVEPLRRTLGRAPAQLVGRLLARDPATRPGAEQTLDTLREIERAPQRRHRRLAVATVIASLALALVVSLFALFRIDDERRAAITARRQQAAVSAFLEDTLAAPDPANAGADVRIAEVLGVAVANARREFAAEPAILMPILRTIGNSYAGLGLNDLAEPVLAQALDISRRIDGKSSRAALGLELALAGAREELDPDRSKSPSEFESVFDRSRQALGDADAISVSAALKLAQWHNQRHHPDAAQDAVDFALAQRPANHSTQPIQRANALIELSKIEDDTGADAHATAHLEEALDIALETGGETGPSAYAARNGLALLAIQAGNLTAAEQQFRAMLAASEHFGESYYGVRRVLNNLGGVLNEQFRYPEAERVLRRALTLSERYGNHNPRAMLSVRSNLANILAAVNRLGESGAMRESIRAESIEVNGADHPFSIMATSNLAEQRILEGDGEAAWKLARDVAVRSARVLGKQHIFSIEGHELIARARFLSGEHDAALAEIAQLCDEKREVFGRGQQYVLTCMTHRAEMLAGIGRRAEARELQQRVVDETIRQFGTEHPGVAAARVTLDGFR